MVNSTKFAKRLQKILEHYELSATAFSEELSFNRSTISHLLSGRNKPSLEFVMKVLERFPEVELYWLLNGKGTFPSSKSELKNTDPKTTPPSQVEKPSQQKTVPEETKSTQLKIEIPPSPSPEKVVIPKHENDHIERIVVFYKNGTFKEYKSI